MSEHLTEEEQLEALKNWWKENGTSLIVGVVVAVGGYFGWQGWQGQQQQAAETASAIYQDVLTAVAVADMTDEQRATANHLSTQLKDQHSDSLYAHNAALLMAKLAVEAQQQDKAIEELQWLLEQQPAEEVALLTRLRLARVLADQQQYDQALSQLQGVEAKSFSASYAEVRGDIYLAQGKLNEARAAYQLALQQLSEKQAGNRNLLEMKLADLQLPSAVDEVKEAALPEPAVVAVEGASE